MNANTNWNHNLQDNEAIEEQALNLLLEDLEHFSFDEFELV